MRKRLRTLPQRVYSYDLQHVRVPERVWQIAKLQQFLWNDLCVLGAIAAGQAAVEPRLKALHWWCWEYNAAQLVRLSTLDWVNGPQVVDRYRAAVKGALTRIKKGVPPGQDAGFPRLHGGLRRVRIAHRMTGGGMPAPDLLSATRGWRVRVKPRAFAADGGESEGDTVFAADSGESSRVCESAGATGGRSTGCGSAAVSGGSSRSAGYWDGTFGLDAETRVEFAIHEKRRKALLPPESIVKGVALCGELVRPFGWQWTLQFTVEEEFAANGGERAASHVAGLDIGWRKFAADSGERIGVSAASGGGSEDIDPSAEAIGGRTATKTSGDYLRVGMLTDTDGATYELRLLFDGANSSQRRAGLTYDWRDIQWNQQSMDEAKDELKRSLIPLVAAKDRPRLAQMGIGGLMKLRAESPEGSPRRVLMDQWAEHHDRLHRVQTAVRLHLLRRRKYQYRLLASWLTKRYGVIAMEDDMELTPLVRSDDPAIQAAQRYRMMAGLYEFRQALRNAAQRNGCRIMGSAKGTTGVCYECGAPVTGGAALVHTCDNGHAHDQDYNAAMNLCRQAVAELSQDEQVGVVFGGAAAPELPQQLRAVMVVCSSE